MLKFNGIKKRQVATTIALGLIIPFAILVVWWLSAPHYATIGKDETGSIRIFSYPIGGETIVPTIAEVADVLLHPFKDPKLLDSGSLAWCFFISLLRVLVGYAMAVVTAVPLGLLAGRNRIARDILGPTVEVLRPISPIAWMPVLILAFGFSSLASWIFGDNAWSHDVLGGLTMGIVLIVWSSSFFPLFLDTMHGSMSVKAIYVELARINGASRTQIFFKVILPASLPSVITGMRISMGLCWRAIVAAEIFPGTTGGLGYMITTSHEVVEYKWAFAVILIIALSGLVINSGFGLAERRLAMWQAKER